MAIIASLCERHLRPLERNELVLTCLLSSFSGPNCTRYSGYGRLDIASNVCSDDLYPYVGFPDTQSARFEEVGGLNSKSSCVVTTS